MPGGASKTGLASSLATLCTESDSGRETLQAVADTLVQAIQQSPPKAQGSEPAYAYVQLAQFSRYEKLKVNLETPEFKAAISHLIALEKSRDNANFTLSDLSGKEWTLKSIKGKVVLVNFWATWCPPCRKEMPDMEKIYRRFKDKGLVILAISDEEESKVRPFIEEKGYTFPILLDPGRKANTAFGIQGIPNSFVFDRFGRLQAVAIDGRSERQLLDLLAKAGLK
ncbi:MAG: TlpA family protein disulfide reductase [Armatimonadetes bacterium]|nr:TlpA family protein disulfide reductase [Armatimonadota bacterium]